VGALFWCSFCVRGIISKRKKYRQAVFLFQDASVMQQSYILYHNMAIAHYNLKQYDSAYVFFLKAASCCDKKEDLVPIYEALAFTPVWRGKISEAKKHFLFLNNFETYEATPDSIALAFLCKDYSYILRNIRGLGS